MYFAGQPIKKDNKNEFKTRLKRDGFHQAFLP